jgi:hypothetical protein
VKVSAKLKINVKKVPVNWKGTLQEFFDYRGTDMDKAAGTGRERKGLVGLTKPDIDGTAKHSFKEMDCDTCCPNGTKGKLYYLASLDFDFTLDITTYYLNWENPSDRITWGKFLVFVLNHENLHVADARKFGNNLMDAVKKQPVTGFNASICTTDPAEIQKIKDELEKKVKEYEDLVIVSSRVKFAIDFSKAAAERDDGNSVNIRQKWEELLRQR